MSLDYSPCKGGLFNGRAERLFNGRKEGIGLAQCSCLFSRPNVTRLLMKDKTHDISMEAFGFFCLGRLVYLCHIHLGSERNNECMWSKTKGPIIETIPQSCCVRKRKKTLWAFPRKTCFLRGPYAFNHTLIICIVGYHMGMYV